MTPDLFLHPKVLDYQGDKYELIKLAMRWARSLKAKGTPETLSSLVDKSLVDIVEGRLKPQDILAIPVPVEPAKEETPDAVSVAEDAPRTLPPDDEEDTEKKKTKKKKKDE